MFYSTRFFIKFINYRVHINRINNFSLNVDDHAVCKKIIIHLIAKSCFKKIHDEKVFFVVAIKTGRVNTKRINLSIWKKCSDFLVSENT